MNFQTFVNISLVINLASSLFNVILYGIGYTRVNKSKVDGQLIRIKRNLLFQFLIVVIVTIIFSAVFWVALTDSDHVAVALYVLNFALLLLNIGFNINALSLAWITKGYNDRTKKSKNKQ